MTTFNTGNPIGSTDARDLSDNAENFDKALGTLDATWTDRLGVTRDSFEGRLAKGSFYRVGDFTTGYTLTNMRQTLEYSGHEYSWAGTFPKVVAAGATPAASGGISSTAWVDRTDLTLRADLAADSSDVLIAGKTAEDIKRNTAKVFNVYASNFGVVGNTTSDMTANLAAATAYAKDNSCNLIIDVDGVILVSQWRLPSNISVQGLGIDRTIIKQLSSVDINTHTVTNDQNQVTWSDSDQTGFYESNNGNEYIRISDMTIDGNGFRAAQYSGYGSALALSYVKHAIVENVKAINGHQHCIDICGADYQEHGELGVYSDAKKGSFNVHLINCQGINPVSDDAITTHTSGNIWIYNPYSYNDGANVGYNQQGLEIDDGSWDVHVIGGYAKGFAKGLQVKGHSAYTMAANVCTVDGFISEGNKWGFNVEHGLTAGTTTSSAFAVTLKNCKNIRCADVIDTNSANVSGLKALMVDSYIGVKIENFTSYGNLSSVTASDYISIEKNSKCVSIDGAFFYNLPSVNDACIVTGDSAGSSLGAEVRNTRIEHIIAIDCACPVVLGMSAGAHYIDDIYAATSVATVPYAVRLGYAALNSLSGKGSYVGTIYTYGYTNDIVSDQSYAAGTYARVPSSDSYDFSLDVKAKFAYAGDTTTDRYWDFGVLSSASHMPAAAYGIGHRFRLKHASNGYQDLSAIVTRLASGASSPAAYMQFYLNNGTANVARVQFNQDGTVRSTTDNTSNLGTATYRWATVYAGTGTINTSDEREKSFCDDELSDAVLDVWEKINFRAFKFNDAISEKGVDGARVHFGVGAQTVKKAFKDAGLDAFKYALLCYDEWDEVEEVKDIDGNVVVPYLAAGSRYGIRYEEALVLEAALMRRTTERLQARIASLEAVQ